MARPSKLVGTVDEFLEKEEFSRKWHKEGRFRRAYRSSGVYLPGDERRILLIERGRSVVRGGLKTFAPDLIDLNLGYLASPEEDYHETESYRYDINHNRLNFTFDLIYVHETEAEATRRKANIITRLRQKESSANPRQWDEFCQTIRTIGEVGVGYEYGKT